MGSLNRATLLGNVGKAPEVRNLQNGNKVAQFSLATTEPAYTTQQGQQVEARTEWHTVVAWAGLATIVERYLQQGQQVYVEGKIRYRQYDNKQGEKRYVTEIIADNIVLLKNGQQQPAQPQQPQYQQPQYQQPYAGGYGQNEPDLPY
ncbi:MAG: single-stranded DNA-binding protein [Lachnospiraceae bacterium]|nr:single-stranded DNA-binding protein [Lachnospiraceae bacterium]